MGAATDRPVTVDAAHLAMVSRPDQVVEVLAGPE